MPQHTLTWLLLCTACIGQASIEVIVPAHSNLTALRQWKYKLCIAGIVMLSKLSLTLFLTFYSNYFIYTDWWFILCILIICTIHSYMQIEHSKVKQPYSDSNLMPNRLQTRTAHSAIVAKDKMFSHSIEECFAFSSDWTMMKNLKENFSLAWNRTYGLLLPDGQWGYGFDPSLSWDFLSGFQFILATLATGAKGLCSLQFFLFIKVYVNQQTFRYKCNWWGVLCRDCTRNKRIIKIVSARKGSMKQKLSIGIGSSAIVCAENAVPSYMIQGPKHHWNTGSAPQE